MSDRRSFESLPHRPTWAQIDLANLRHNYQVLRRRLDPGAGLMAVLKANAYGHGAVECGRALEEIGVDWFGVAGVVRGAGVGVGCVRCPVGDPSPQHGLSETRH